MIIGFDINLGLPQDFIPHTNLETKSYANNNLKDMLDDFENNQFELMFLPAGTLPYVKSDYQINAQATLGTKRINQMCSNLVSAEDFPLNKMNCLKWGRVNKYCTTSFWAPLIYFMQQWKNGTKIDFINTEGFKDMLFKVADKKVDIAMVWDIILKRNPNASNRVYQLAHKDDLPAPIIISKSTITTDLKNKITNFKSQDTRSLFNGFSQPDVSLIESFKHQMSLAREHFNLIL